MWVWLRKLMGCCKTIQDSGNDCVDYCDTECGCKDPCINSGNACNKACDCQVNCMVARAACADTCEANGIDHVNGTFKGQYFSGEEYSLTINGVMGTRPLIRGLTDDFNEGCCVYGYGKTKREIIRHTHQGVDYFGCPDSKTTDDEKCYHYCAIPGTLFKRIFIDPLEFTFSLAEKSLVKWSGVRKDEDAKTEHSSCQKFIYGLSYIPWTLKGIVRTVNSPISNFTYALKINKYVAGLSATGSLILIPVTVVSYCYAGALIIGSEVSLSLIATVMGPVGFAATLIGVPCVAKLRSGIYAESIAAGNNCPGGTTLKRIEIDGNMYDSSSGNAPPAPAGVGALAIHGNANVTDIGPIAQRGRLPAEYRQMKVAAREDEFSPADLDPNARVSLDPDAMRVYGDLMAGMAMTRKHDAKRATDAAKDVKATGAPATPTTLGSSAAAYAVGSDIVATDAVIAVDPATLDAMRFALDVTANALKKPNLSPERHNGTGVSDSKWAELTPTAEKMRAAAAAESPRPTPAAPIPTSSYGALITSLLPAGSSLESDIVAPIMRSPIGIVPNRTQLNASNPTPHMQTTGTAIGAVAPNLSI